MGTGSGITTQSWSKRTLGLRGVSMECIGVLWAEEREAKEGLRGRTTAMVGGTEKEKERGAHRSPLELAPRRCLR